MMDMEKYKKSKGAAGLKGVEYQINLLALFALEGFSWGNWKLSTENEKAGKFDDMVFQSSNGDFLLQSKHKDGKKKNVSSEDFWSTNSNNDDFSLSKYFSSFVNIRKKFEVKLLFLCTNIDLSTGEDIFQKEDVSDDSFQRGTKSYKFNKTYQSKLKDITKTCDDVLLTEFCENIRLICIDDTELEKI
ncbi:hypothetical protein JTB14_018136 [Gonioctena quinquepunctata]|nr:hypothetical protein JTB14_018136 [Gonioctena quinquepunctata]